MIYPGSKNKIGPELYEFISNHSQRTKGYWVEPFVGGGNMIQHVPTTWYRYGGDRCKPVIALLRRCHDLTIDSLEKITMYPHNYDVWDLKSPMTKEIWEYYKGRQIWESDNPLVGFLGTHLSRNGDFFHSYREESGRDFVAEGLKHLQRQSEKLKTCHFWCDTYTNFPERSNAMPDESVVYCDPPYKGVRLEYAKMFDHEIFYAWCRWLHRMGYKVYISERTMPDDFECIWEKRITQNSNKKTEFERLFIYKG